MANYNTLKTSIQEVIRTNGNEEITGQLLQNTLIAMINSLGAEYQFAGIAVPSTNPGTPDQNVAYIAGPGTYPNFNNTTIPMQYIGIFQYDENGWQYNVFQTATMGFRSQGDGVVQLYDGDTPIFPITKAAAVLTANNTVLENIVKALDLSNSSSVKGYLFRGVVSTDITPDTPQQPVFYLAAPGSYTHFGSSTLTVNDGYIGVIKWGGSSWSLDQIRVGDVDTVKYTEQSLTDAQKAQARTNIGAADAADVSALAGGHIKKGVRYDGGDGSEKTGTDWFVGLDYIPVKQGDTVIWNPGLVPASPGSYALITYDTNKQKVGYFASSAAERTVTIASGVAYVRPSFALSNIENAKIIVNGVTVWKTVDSIGYVSEMVAEQTTQINGLDTRLSSVEDGTIIYDTVDNTIIVGIALNATNTAIIIPETSPQSSATAYIALNAGESVKITRLTGTGGRFRAGVTTQIPADGVAVTNGKRIDSPTAGAVLFEYTASANCYVVCSTSTANIGALSFEKIISAQDAFNKLEAAIQSDESPEEQIQARFVQSLFANKTNPTKCLSLLHFSDIHDGVTNLQRIVDFRDKWATYIDDAICTGDMVAQSMEDRFIFDDAVVDGSGDILMVIGNHDVAKYDSGYDWYYYAGGQAAYQRYMQNVASWGVTQPSGAGQNNYYPCYYYKDYTDKGVRLIVLDMMDWGKLLANNVADADNPQYVWLQNTLNAARTAGLHVVIAEHFPFWAKTVGNHPQNADIIDSDFSLPNRLSSFISAYDTEIGGQALLTVSQMIEDFKTAGGAFACWICGHTHFDNFEKVTANGQKVIVIGTANYTKDTNTIRDAGNESIDLFNVFSVDTINRVVKVFRIGGHLTPALQKIDTMHFTY